MKNYERNPSDRDWSWPGLIAMGLITAVFFGLALANGWSIPNLR